MFPWLLSNCCCGLCQKPEELYFQGIKFVFCEVLFLNKIDIFVKGLKWNISSHWKDIRAKHRFIGAWCVICGVVQSRNLIKNELGSIKSTQRRKKEAAFSCLQLSKLVLILSGWWVNRTMLSNSSWGRLIDRSSCRVAHAFSFGMN